MREWQPASDTERSFAAALHGGDSQEFARLLMSNPLYLLVRGAHHAPTPRQLHDQLPDQLQHEQRILAFTSPETLRWALGSDGAGHHESDIATLLQRQAGLGCLLVVNLGSPISVALPLESVADLAAGHQSLIGVQELQRAITNAVITDIRRACLAGLTGSDRQRHDSDAGRMAETPVTNALEAALQNAERDHDGVEFFIALVASEMIIPATAASVEDTRAIPVFSSVAALHTIAAKQHPHSKIPFVDVLANWPSEEHVLCLNPGTTTELVLPWSAITELIDAAANDPRPNETTDDGSPST